MDHRPNRKGTGQQVSESLFKTGLFNKSIYNISVVFSFGNNRFKILFQLIPIMFHLPIHLKTLFVGFVPFPNALRSFENVFEKFRKIFSDNREEIIRPKTDEKEIVKSSEVNSSVKSIFPCQLIIIICSI